ncbi:MAG: hypothetical protein M3Z05_21075 [Gemmatimonadota bacterium]|nr:hypothetical protein [Gemmatimonadota bacterium]
MFDRKPVISSDASVVQLDSIAKQVLASDPELKALALTNYNEAYRRALSSTAVVSADPKVVRLDRAAKDLLVTDVELRTLAVADYPTAFRRAMNRAMTTLAAGTP